MNFKFRMKLSKKVLTIVVLILLVAGAIVGCIAFFVPKLNKVEKYDKDEISFLEKQGSLFPKSENLKSSGRGRVLKPSSNFQRHGCPNEDCVLSAAKMIKWINKSADPCEDFYNFACGNFAREYSLPEGWDAYSSVDVRNEEIELKIKNILEEPATINDSESMNNTKKVYSSCMNITYIDETSIYTLRQILTENRMGEWPLLDPEWKECHVDLEWRMAKLNALGIESLFRLDTEFEKDGNETLQAVMRVANPLIKDDCDDETSAGATEHRALLKAVLDIFEIVNVSDSDIDDVIRFDLLFCNATKNCRNREKKHPGNYGRSTLYDLAKNTSQINWIRWRNLVFSYMNLNFPQDREFIFVDGVEHCIRNINDLLSNTPSRVLGNYLAWKYVFHNLGFLGRPFGQLLENHHHLFKETYMNSDRWVPRWRKCVIFIEDIMPMALLKTYYQSYIIEGIEKEMDDIVAKLKEALKDTGFEEWKHEIDLTEVAAVFPIKMESFYDKYYPTMYFMSPSFIEYGNNLMTMRMRKLMKGVAANKRKSDMEYAILKLYPPFRLNSPIFFQDDRIIVTLAKLVHTITTTLPKYNTLSTFGIPISNALARSIVKKAVYSENKAPPVIKKQNSCFSKSLPYPVSRSTDNPQYQQKHISQYDYMKYDYIGNIVAFKAYFDFKAKSISGDDVLPGLDYNAEKLFFISYAQEYCEIRKNRHSLGSGHHRVNSALKIFSSFSETFRCAAHKPMNLAC